MHLLSRFHSTVSMLNSYTLIGTITSLIIFDSAHTQSKANLVSCSRTAVTRSALARLPSRRRGLVVRRAAHTRVEAPNERGDIAPEGEPCEDCRAVHATIAGAACTFVSGGDSLCDRAAHDICDRSRGLVLCHNGCRALIFVARHDDAHVCRHLIPCDRSRNLPYRQLF